MSKVFVVGRSAMRTGYFLLEYELRLATITTKQGIVFVDFATIFTKFHKTPVYFDTKVFVT